MRTRWLIILLLAGGCAGHRPLGQSGAAAQSTIRSYRRGWELLESWDGLVRLKGRYGEESFSVRQAVVLERPTRVYLEALLPLGKSGPVVAVADGRLSVVWLAERGHLEAPATAETMRRLVGVEISPRELTALIAGFGIPWDGYGAGSFEPDEQGRVWLNLRDASRQRTARLLVDGTESALLAGEVRDADGESVYGFSYEQLKQVGSLVFPRRIRLHGGEMSLDIRLGSVNRNTGRRSDELFRPEPAPGSRRIWLEELETPLMVSGGE